MTGRLLMLGRDVEFQAAAPEKLRWGPSRKEPCAHSLDNCDLWIEVEGCIEGCIEGCNVQCFISCVHSCLDHAKLSIRFQP
jgi:hypothetical protein